jgi:thiosulfate reductase cytochrome b subunit
MTKTLITLVVLSGIVPILVATGLYIADFNSALYVLCNVMALLWFNEYAERMFNDND